MSFYYRPFIPLTLAMIFGIAVGESVPGYRLPAWCIAVGCLLLFIFFICRRKAAAISPLILFAALGYLSIQPWTAPRFSAEHLRHAATGDKALVTGVVLTPPALTGFRQSFILD